MADTGFKLSYGPIKGSYERLSDYLIVYTSDGQIMHLDRAMIDALESLMDAVAILRGAAKKPDLEKEGY